MRKTKLFIATLAMSMLLSSTSLAGTWQAQDNGQWKYQNDDGSFATGWIEDGGKNYYLDANGIMLANTTTPDGYYVGADGAWIAGQEAPKFDFSIAACSIKYTGHKVFSFDYDGYPCVALYYDYTNKDAEPTGAYLADYYITVFQNGVECDSAFLSYDEREEAFDNYTKKVTTGTTINVAQAYRISDMSDITIQIKEMWNWSNPRVDTVTLSLR